MAEWATKASNFPEFKSLNDGNDPPTNLKRCLNNLKIPTPFPWNKRLAIKSISHRIHELHNKANVLQAAAQGNWFSPRFYASSRFLHQMTPIFLRLNVAIQSLALHRRFLDFILPSVRQHSVFLRQTLLPPSSLRVNSFTPFCIPAARFLPLFITDSSSFDLDPFRKEKDAVTVYILTSLLHKHAYLGITQCPLQRARQHYVGISNAVAATARSVQSGLPRTLFLARRYHLRVYHYIANNHPSSFMFTPLLHIHCLDALNFEMLAIKFLGPLALNETHRNVRNLPAHPYGSSAPRKKCRQGSRHRSRSSSSRDHVCTHGNMFYPILFRVDRTHVHFHRLHNLLSLHIGSLINVHVTPGRPLSSFKLVSATFGQSRVINHPGISNLQQLLVSFGKTVNSPFSFMIIPRRSLTLHQAVMIFIDQIDGSFRNVHLPAFYSQLPRSFWFNLFRTISSRQSQVDARPRLVLRVRNFIKFYCHKFYSLTTRDLNCGLHSSISIDYHPLLHLPAISALQKSMLTCLVPPSATRFALAGSFTTIKSPSVCVCVHVCVCVGREREGNGKGSVCVVCGMCVCVCVYYLCMLFQICLHMAPSRHAACSIHSTASPL